MTQSKLLIIIGVALFVIGGALMAIGTTSMALFLTYAVIAVVGIGLASLGRKQRDTR